MNKRFYMFLMLLAVLFHCAFIVETAHAQDVTYTDMEVPAFGSYFKTWEDYRCITNKNSDNYKFIHNYMYADSEGFCRCACEPDFGVPEDYYLVAMGSYYSSKIGTKFRITTDTGNVFYVALADQKDNKHTDSRNMYGSKSKDVIEFLIDKKTLNKTVKKWGSANVYMPLNGKVVKVEKMTFNH